jgi:hypothetical protein
LREILGQIQPAYSPADDGNLHNGIIIAQWMELDKN